MSHDQGIVPLPRDKSLGQYIEFDLSKLHNSKGGFLIDEDVSVEGKLKTLEDIKRERERERERAKALQEPGISLDPDKQTQCRECGTKEIDDVTRKVFGMLVCKMCMREKPEKYSLLTKTEVKEDYLLTDSELRDGELLPHLLKANPHKATYSNMMLFLRCQVEDFAFGPQKWGSEEGLDAEFRRREDEKTRKRGKRFAQKLADLRRRTRDNVWQKRQDEIHVHDYQSVLQAGREHVQRCGDCGHEIEVEEF
ncbi:DNA repair protein [Tilletiaria anomala UBC 951]|uniref:DNA repair protein RAD14 n=1 Tax=Tilletiaria anomala (strain ATCC 24038 / CBS 436.72 / UBC 951) TaxID=1037660 RepID=A0A066VEK1_TILAU|nr:DNA repair protein [Tilletiaria anomala UBC 951]KDN39841.1 DNA repair protein [Tilletiaria anomala UBC 951]